jgi:hypothetical protein
MEITDATVIGRPELAKFKHFFTLMSDGIDIIKHPRMGKPRKRILWMESNESKLRFNVASEKDEKPHWFNSEASQLPYKVRVNIICIKIHQFSFLGHVT